VSTLGDRLRGIVQSGGSAASGGSEDPPDPAGADAAHVLDGEWLEASGRRILVVDRQYRPGHRHGRTTIADALPSGDTCWPELSLLAGTSCAGRALFIDLETTGLAGGAGTYAFLVGCAWFDGGVFRVRQFFLSSFTAERALLEAVRELASTCHVIVTYNGKTFDLPLIETRFLLHRLETPFTEMPHVDMLHPARRMWRPGEDGAEGGCRLTHLERLLCGHLREDDVPGFEIPSRYFQYVRSGDARPLAGVLEHNRLDLVSLALVTAYAAQLVEAGAEAARTAREALGLGRLYERGGHGDRARACFARAAGLSTEPLDADPLTRIEALRAYAVLSRRQRRYPEAAAAWQQIVSCSDCPPRVAREAAEALAIHHEHRLRDPRIARSFAIKSLQDYQSASQMQALQHRLARLDRKLGMPAADAAPLF
jgi:uncharacterized protein YprB with RNaseH-like and TPR domain